MKSTFSESFGKFTKSVQNVNHMWSDVLRLAGCGERAVLSSQTAIQWHLLLCLFVEHKSELKVFLKSIEKKKKEELDALGPLLWQGVFTRGRVWKIMCLEKVT